MWKNWLGNIENSETMTITKTITITKTMTITNTFREHPERKIFETCDL